MSFSIFCELSRNCLCLVTDSSFWRSLRLRMTVWMKLIWHLNLKAFISEDWRCFIEHRFKVKMNLSLRWSLKKTWNSSLCCTVLNTGCHFLPLSITSSQLPASCQYFLSLSIFRFCGGEDMNFRRWLMNRDSKQIQTWILGFLLLADNIQLAFLPMKV